MFEKIQVTILDDHQSIIDSYLYRLNSIPQIKVVATIAYGEELELTLAEHPTDVLLLDVNVATSRSNVNPYPILHLIPKLLERYSDLNILVISMYAERGLIRAVMEAGANGYILKDDLSSIRNIGDIVLTIANGAIHFSSKAHQLLLKNQPGSDDEPFLSSQQVEVLALCQTYPDDSSAQIAARLSVANSTVRKLLSSAYVKLDVHTRSAAIAKAQQLGLITTTPQSHIV